MITQVHVYRITSRNQVSGNIQKYILVFDEFKDHNLQQIGEFEIAQAIDVEYLGQANYVHDVKRILG